MDPELPISDVMTTDPSTVDIGQPLSDVYRLIQRAPFHHIPVVDADRPVGMISTTDILRLVYDIDGTDDRTLRTLLDHQFTIEDAMSPDIRSLRQDATLRDAAAAMADGSIHSVVVVDDLGDLVGIVTTTDVMKLIAAG